MTPTATVGNVRVERERHSYSGRTHCHNIDIHLLFHSGKRPWKLMVAKEFWWDGRYTRPIESVQ